MRVLVDEDLPPAIADLLRDIGHEAEHVRGAGLGGMPDSRIFASACECGSLLITADLGFGDPRQYPPSACGGIILLRFPDYFRRAEIVSLMRRFLETADLASLAGVLVVVEPGRYRVRR